MSTRSLLRPSHALLLLLSCSESSAVLNQPGDPCRHLYGDCRGEDLALLCENELWTLRDCAEVCAELAPDASSLGCTWRVDAETQRYGGRCECAPAPGGCLPGWRRCADETHQLDCANGQWVERDCAALCATSHPGTLSLGCVTATEPERGACACTLIGTPCDEPGGRCIGEHAVARCDGATWAALDCRELCSDPDATCSPRATGAHLCACE